MRFVLFFALLGSGFFMVVKTNAFIGFFGRNGWAERHMGPGGSFAFYKILGTGLLILAMLIVTGLFDNVFEAPFKFLFGGFNG